LSNTSHIKSEAGERGASPLSTAQWLLGGLSLGAAIGAHLVAARLAPHASSSELNTLAGSVALFVWLSRHVRLKPPNDPLSRLRAPWEPSVKRLALLGSLALFGLSLWHQASLIQIEYSRLSPARVLSFAPLKSGLYQISGTPKVESPPYRWVIEGAAQAEEGWVDESAPYLTPVQEFKGQLLLISDEPITEGFERLTGRLLSSQEAAQGSFLSYRSYMGVAREASIYLFELRGAPWFDVKAALLSLWSLILALGVWSSATRDPENQSGLVYIPPELRDALSSGDDFSPRDEMISGDKSSAEEAPHISDESL